jgi:hypothetical protein
MRNISFIDLFQAFGSVAFCSSEFFPPLGQLLRSSAPAGGLSNNSRRSLFDVGEIPPLSGKNLRRR